MRSLEREEALALDAHPGFIGGPAPTFATLTFASLLIDSGANPKAVQQFLGHSKIQTTFDTYGHLFPGSHDEVRERMDAYLEEAREPVSSG